MSLEPELEYINLSISHLSLSLNAPINFTPIIASGRE